MKLVKAYNSVSLVLRIVIGMVIGAALALLIPNAAVTAPGIGILGTLTKDDRTEPVIDGPENIVHPFGKVLIRILEIF